MSKVAGKGASVIRYLIQVFFKRLDSLGFENNQVREVTNAHLSCHDDIFCI